MDGRNHERRTPLWAMAEISWEDQSGIPKRLPATLEDTSSSGACLRLKAPIQVGARLVVRWHREQFSAVARNCRRDGWEFLLGVQREADASPPVAERESQIKDAASAARPLSPPPAISTGGSAVSLSQAQASDALR